MPTYQCVAIASKASDWGTLPDCREWLRTMTYGPYFFNDIGDFMSLGVEDRELPPSPKSVLPRREYRVYFNHTIIDHITANSRAEANLKFLLNYQYHSDVNLSDLSNLSIVELPEDGGPQNKREAEVVAPEAEVFAE